MSGTPTPPAGEADLTPAQRLAISREHLRAAMRTPPRSTHRPGVAGALRERLRSNSTLALMMEIIDSWWHRHPMRSAAVLAGEASRTVVGPLARRKPIQFVLLAFAGGVLIAWLRPWRWFLHRRMFGGILRQLLPRMLAAIPSASWLALFAGLVGRGAGRPAAPPAASPVRSPRPDL